MPMKFCDLIQLKTHWGLGQIKPVFPSIKFFNRLLSESPYLYLHQNLCLLHFTSFTRLQTL
jgi:hypothetical protein